MPFPLAARVISLGATKPTGRDSKQGVPDLRVEISGVERVQKTLDNKVRDLYSLEHEAAVIVRDELKKPDITPVRTGRLRRSTRVVRGKGIVRIGAPYAGYVHRKGEKRHYTIKARARIRKRIRELVTRRRQGIRRRGVAR